MSEVYVPFKMNVLPLSQRYIVGVFYTLWYNWCRFIIKDKELLAFLSQKIARNNELWNNPQFQFPKSVKWWCCTSGSEQEGVEKGREPPPFGVRESDGWAVPNICHLEVM